MRRVQLCGLLLGLLALGSLAQAYPNVLATSGIVGVPTTQTVPRGVLVGAADVFFFDDASTAFRAVYGLGENFEVGAVLTAGEDETLGATIKYAFPAGVSGVRWALGASLLTADERDDGTQFFFLGSIPLTITPNQTFSFSGTAGVNLTDVGDDSALRPFVGAQMFLGATEIAAEFEFEADDLGSDAVFSILARRNLGAGFSGQIGFSNAFGFGASGDNAIFLGASYNFGNRE